MKMPGGTDILATHANDSSMAALMPCIDYEITMAGKILGNLVSVAEDGQAPWEAYNAAGDYLGEFPSIRQAFIQVYTHSGSKI
jgi:hypothetical protein